MNNDIRERIDSETPEIIKELYLTPYRHFSYLFWNIGFKTIVDLGCGNGFGINIMRNYFKQVLGVDKDMLLQTSDFIVDDVTNLKQIKDKSFDGAFCFEVIEHLNEEDQKKLVKEMNRITKMGFVIGSTSKSGPNTIAGVEIFKGKRNSYHLKELDLDELKNLVKNEVQDLTIMEFGSTYLRDKEFIRIDPFIGQKRLFCNYVMVLKE